MRKSKIIITLFVIAVLILRSNDITAQKIYNNIKIVGAMKNVMQFCISGCSSGPDKQC